MFLWYNTPKLYNCTFLIPKRFFITPVGVFWAIVRENQFTGMSCSSVKEKKQKKLKSKKSRRTRICCPLIGSEPNFGRAGDLPNVITHAKCQINWYKLSLRLRVEVSWFSTTTADAITTAKPCVWLSFTRNMFMMDLQLCVLCQTPPRKVEGSNTHFQHRCSFCSWSIL